MIKFIIKRILWMIPILLGVIIIVFTIEYFTPGDPVASILGSRYTQEQYDIKQHELGLDQPYIVQLYNYIKNIVTKLDLGTSYTSKRSVSTMIGERIKPSLIIGVLGVLISTIIAIPLGVIAAVHQGKALDTIAVGFSIVFAAVPSYLLAMFALLLFCLRLQWLPAAGIDHWYCYILPVLCTVLNPLVVTLRMTRSSMLDTIRSDYVRTARAKGVPERQVLTRHALKNALIPVLTSLGMHLAGALGGSILVETIFTVPGMGILMKEAIAGFDYPLSNGCVLVLSFIMCVMNLLTDLAYAAVDPRVYDQYTGGKKKRTKSSEKKEVVAVNG